MKDFLRKLTSRKLWAAIAGIVTGIALALGADASDIQIITGAVTSVISVVAYIAAEGYVDASRVKTAIEAIQEGIAVITDEDETK